MIALVAMAKRTTLRNKCDRIFSDIIKLRDRVCQRCGSTERLQCAHIWSRIYFSTRWDEDNAVALCSGCHQYFSNYTAHWHEWIIERLGPRGYYGLLKRALLPARTDYGVLLNHLERRLAVLKAPQPAATGRRGGSQ